MGIRSKIHGNWKHLMLLPRKCYYHCGWYLINLADQILSNTLEGVMDIWVRHFFLVFVLLWKISKQKCEFSWENVSGRMGWAEPSGWTTGIPCFSMGISGSKITPVLFPPGPQRQSRPSSSHCVQVGAHHQGRWGNPGNKMFPRTLGNIVAISSQLFANNSSSVFFSTYFPGLTPPL